LKNINKEKYVNELHNDELINYNNRDIIAIDPGMCDLLNAVNGPEKHNKNWRYTQVKRKLSLKTKKYSIIRKFY